MQAHVVLNSIAAFGISYVDFKCYFLNFDSVSDGNVNCLGLLVSGTTLYF